MLPKYVIQKNRSIKNFQCDILKTKTIFRRIRHYFDKIFHRTRADQNAALWVAVSWPTEPGQSHQTQKINVLQRHIWQAVYGRFHFPSLSDHLYIT
jgi:hypothetical protein